MPLNQAQHRLIEQLIDRMQASNGVGIAAPQVGIPWQIIIVASRPTLRYPQAPRMEPIAMINPQILEDGGEQIQDWEGCLSVPNMRGLVTRAQHVTVRYHDLAAGCQCERFSGFIARIIQHEYDHLQGRLFVDRVKQSADLITEDEYQKLLIS